MLATSMRIVSLSVLNLKFSIKHVLGVQSKCDLTVLSSLFICHLGTVRGHYCDESCVLRTFEETD